MKLFSTFWWHCWLIEMNLWHWKDLSMHFSFQYETIFFRLSAYSSIDNETDHETLNRLDNSASNHSNFSCRPQNLLRTLLSKLFLTLFHHSAAHVFLCFFVLRNHHQSCFMIAHNVCCCCFCVSGIPLSPIIKGWGDKEIKTGEIEAGCVIMNISWTCRLVSGWNLWILFACCLLNITEIGIELYGFVSRGGVGSISFEIDDY